MKENSLFARQQLQLVLTVVLHKEVVSYFSKISEKSSLTY